MGDSGEGLVDAEARIAERMEEREADRRRTSGPAPVVDPEAVRQKESLKLAKAELTRQAAPPRTRCARSRSTRRSPRSTGAWRKSK